MKCLIVIERTATGSSAYSPSSMPEQLVVRCGGASRPPERIAAMAPGERTATVGHQGQCANDLTSERAIIAALSNSLFGSQTMDSPERTAVRRGLDELKPHLATYASQVLSQSMPDPAVVVGGDIQAIIRTIFDNWEIAFRSRLPRVVRSYLHELLDVRNRWAHEEAFSPDEAKRALDTMQQIARAIGASRAISPQGPMQGDSTARLKATSLVSTPPRRIGAARAVQTLRTWSAEDLHAEFVKTVNGKRPHIASYSWVYGRLFGLVPRPWSQGYGDRVAGIARSTTPQEVAGLGPVALDTFVVGKQTGAPSPGHWPTVSYDRASWDRVFAGAQLLHGDKRAPWET